MNRIAAAAFALTALLLCATASGADIDGDWNLSLNAAEGSTYVVLSISTDGDDATATSSDSELKGTYIDGQLKLSGKLYLIDAGYAADTEMDARLDGQKLKGRMIWDTYTATVDGVREQ